MRLIDGVMTLTKENDGIVTVPVRCCTKLLGGVMNAHVVGIASSALASLCRPGQARPGRAGVCGGMGAHQAACGQT